MILCVRNKHLMLLYIKSLLETFKDLKILFSVSSPFFKLYFLNHIYHISFYKFHFKMILGCISM